MGFFFKEIFHFAKTTEFSLKGGWRTVRVIIDDSGNFGVNTTLLSSYV